jgi:hypothetical protein
MEAKTRRQAIVLAGLLGVLAIALWWNMGLPPEPPTTVRSRAASRQASRRGTAESPVEAIRLEVLAAPRPAPAESNRDPFRFRGGGESGAAPPSPPSSQQPETQAQGEGGGPEAPIQTGPPPIPLRFIGVVRVTEGERLVAVLSDGTGVYRGGEGDIIEGRYRVVRVRLDSVELAYVDGRGHQVLRLSGS